MPYTFSKSERLCSHNAINDLYEHGNRLLSFPYRIAWQVCDDEQPCKVLIAVTKRRYKHAVDRNLVKRRIRECYRLNKPSLYNFLTQNNLHIHLSIHYIHNTILDFDTLQRKWQKALEVLQKDIEKSIQG